MTVTDRPRIFIPPQTADEPAAAAADSPSLSEYAAALVAAGAEPFSLPLTAAGDDFATAVASADGVLITGGKDINPSRYLDGGAPSPGLCDLAEPLRDDREFGVVRELLRVRRPLLAICRGHQVVNIALGGSLFWDLATQRPGPLKHDQLDRRYEEIHTVAVEPGSLLESVVGTSTLGVNSTHHQALDRVAGALRVAATAPDGVIEAAELAPSHAGLLPWFLSVQWHPERLRAKQPAASRLFQCFVAACRGKLKA